jgi:hypothetical protein
MIRYDQRMVPFTTAPLPLLERFSGTSVDVSGEPGTEIVPSGLTGGVFWRTGSVAGAYDGFFCRRCGICNRIELSTWTTRIRYAHNCVVILYHIHLSHQNDHDRCR